jgi:hypothetical protein
MKKEKEFDTYSSIRLDKLLNVPDWTISTKPPLTLK